MASGKVPLFKAVSCRWYCAQAFQSSLKYFSNVLCYSKPLQTWYVPRVRYGALPLGVNPRIYPLTLWDVNVGFIFHPIFHLKPKPLNLCSQAAVVPHLPAPCLPSGDKMRQADLHTKPCNPVFFFLQYLALAGIKKTPNHWRYVPGRVKAMIAQAGF